MAVRINDDSMAVEINGVGLDRAERVISQDLWPELCGSPAVSNRDVPPATTANDANGTAIKVS
jgi:hypothetical protein